MKNFCILFSGIFECDKPQGTTCRGPIGILKNTVETKRSFFWNLRAWCKQFFFKRLSPRWNKLACLISFYRVWQTSNNNILSPTIKVVPHCASIKAISVTPEVFVKEATFPLKILTSPDFFSCHWTWQTLLQKLW